MGIETEYQNTASTGSSANCRRAPDRWPFHSNQPAQTCTEPRTNRSGQQHQEDLARLVEVEGAAVGLADERQDGEATTDDHPPHQPRSRQQRPSECDDRRSTAAIRPRSAPTLALAPLRRVARPALMRSRWVNPEWSPLPTGTGLQMTTVGHVRCHLLENHHDGAEVGLPTRPRRGRRWSCSGPVAVLLDASGPEHGPERPCRATQWRPGRRARRASCGRASSKPPSSTPSTTAPSEPSGSERAAGLECRAAAAIGPEIITLVTATAATRVATAMNARVSHRIRAVCVGGQTSWPNPHLARGHASPSSRNWGSSRAASGPRPRPRLPVRPAPRRRRPAGRVTSRSSGHGGRPASPGRCSRGLLAASGQYQGRCDSSAVSGVAG